MKENAEVQTPYSTEGKAVPLQAWSDQSFPGS